MPNFSAQQPSSRGFLFALSIIMMAYDYDDNVSILCFNSHNISEDVRHKYYTNTTDVCHQYDTGFLFFQKSENQSVFFFFFIESLYTL